MKAAARVLTIISMIYTILFYLIYLIVGLVAGSLPLFLVCILGIALAGTFGGISLASLHKNQKKIWVGVCQLIFAGIVGGILYLCWTPTEEAPKEKIADPYINSSNLETPIKEETKISQADVSEILLNLKKLYEDGIISKEEYEEKRKKYVDLL